MNALSITKYYSLVWKGISKLIVTIVLATKNKILKFYLCKKILPFILYNFIYFKMFYLEISPFVVSGILQKALG